MRVEPRASSKIKNVPVSVVDFQAVSVHRDLVAAGRLL
jgi:hypothetical protein